MHCFVLLFGLATTVFSVIISDFKSRKTDVKRQNL